MKRVGMFFLALCLLVTAAAPAFAFHAKTSANGSTVITRDLCNSSSYTKLSDDGVTFTYGWSWNETPLVKWSDSAAVNWTAYDADGGEIDADVAARTVKIHYFDLLSGDYDSTVTLDLEDSSMTGFYSCAADIPMVRWSNGRLVWARDGTFSVTLQQASAESAIDSVQFRAAYGHTTILFDDFQSTSVSVTVDSGAWEADTLLDEYGNVVTAGEMPIPDSSDNVKRLAAVVTTVNLDTGESSSVPIASKQDSIADIHTFVIGFCLSLTNQLF